MLGGRDILDKVVANPSTPTKKKSEKLSFSTLNFQLSTNPIMVVAVPVVLRDRHEVRVVHVIPDRE